MALGVAFAVAVVASVVASVEFGYLRSSLRTLTGGDKYKLFLQ